MDCASQWKVESLLGAECRFQTRRAHGRPALRRLERAAAAKGADEKEAKEQVALEPEAKGQRATESCGWVLSCVAEASLFAEYASTEMARTARDGLAWQSSATESKALVAVERLVHRPPSAAQLAMFAHSACLSVGIRRVALKPRRRFGSGASIEGPHDDRHRSRVP